MQDYIPCFSCGAKSMNYEGKCHEYMLSSAACYDMFNEVLEREYSDFKFAKAHHFTVDAYAVQHPGDSTNQKAINSVGIHLTSLFFILEKNYALEKAAELKMEFARFNKANRIISPLERPSQFKGLTVFDVWNNDDPEKHFDLCKEWAQGAWYTWSDHHETVKRWVSLFQAS